VAQPNVVVAEVLALVAPVSVMDLAAVVVALGLALVAVVVVVTIPSTLNHSSLLNSAWD